MVRQYEMTIVFDPSLSSEKREEVQKKLLKGFKVTSELDMGSMDLEYQINHQTKGHFLRVNFEGEAVEMASLRETLKILEGILRYLIIKL
jgi:ribosomal protein S6